MATDLGPLSEVLLGMRGRDEEVEHAIGELALGAFLVFGFALHNTTEGLAIVTPLAERRPPSLLRLGALGLIAGAPAILGAFIGASAYNPELSSC